MKIIKLAHVKDVINLIDREEITMSKAAEILNDIVLEVENEKLNELYKKYFDLQDYTLKVQQELIELKIKYINPHTVAQGPDEAVRSGGRK